MQPGRSSLETVGFSVSSVPYMGHTSGPSGSGFQALGGKVSETGKGRCADLRGASASLSVSGEPGNRLRAVSGERPVFRPGKYSADRFSALDPVPGTG